MCIILDTKNNNLNNELHFQILPWTEISAAYHETDEVHEYILLACLDLSPLLITTNVHVVASLEYSPLRFGTDKL